MFRRKDIEEIDAKQQTEGATRAMQKLLLVLPIRHENWFDHLMQALKSNGYQLIVDDIYQNGTILYPFFFKINYKRYLLILLYLE